MLDPQEEARFDELKSMCRDLKVPAPPEIMIGLKVHEGGVLTFDDIQRGHSWTRNFWNWLFFSPQYVTNTQGGFGAGYASMKRINGTVNGTDLQYYTPAVPGVVANSSYGIVVGTSATAFTTEQSALIAQIATGGGGGQFAYQAQPDHSISYDAGTHIWTITMSRVFNNNSGGLITVKETGLVTYAAAGTAFLSERSVLDPTVAVANGAQLTVTYAISMDFSAID